MNTTQLKDKIIETLKKRLDLETAIKEKDLQKVWDIIAGVIVNVESIIEVKLEGKEKRQLAIDIINELVDIPVIPEFIEAKIIGLVVDAIVSALNKIFGKQWIERVIGW